MKLITKLKSIKDLESLTGLSIKDRVDMFYDYYLELNKNKQSNYRIISKIGSGAEIPVLDYYSASETTSISFVSNDYLSFTKHPEIIQAGKNALDIFGSGAGSSPFIGGQSILHDKLEKAIAKFFYKEDAITYTSGYAANSSTLLALLQNDDLAILDMGVHTSVLEGCKLTNKKYFLHNDVDSLERVLQQNKGKFSNLFIVIDGVYSQDGDIAPLDKISDLAKEYGAFLIVDDAHGIGVIGENGKGVFDLYNIYDKVDLITGTFSKTFASVGGYVVGNREIITYLKYFSSANIFSAAATPQSVATVLKVIELMDKEPIWMNNLSDNIRYFKHGLDTLDIDYGNTKSAIFPIMIRNETKTMNVGRMLFENGIYANPILYPAVSRKQTRIRMSLIASHTTDMIDRTLNVLEYVLKNNNVL